MEVHPIHEGETLGQYLTAVRIAHNLSIEDVAKTLGLGRKYIFALEKGAYDQLPSKPYLQGFLRQLSKVYRVPESDLLGQLDAETKAVPASLTAAVPVVGKTKQRLRTLVSGVQVTPVIIAVIAAVCIVLGIVGYMVWQVTQLSRLPGLVITTPAANTKVVPGLVKIEGSTEKGATLSINGQPVDIEQDGHFSTQLQVGPEQSELLFKVQSQYGKSLTQSLPIVVEAGPGAANKKVLVVIQGLQPIELSVRVDTNTPQTVILKTGESRSFEGSSTVIVSTSDAGNTKVNVNGKDLGVLGKVGERLDLIPFTAEIATPEATTTSVQATSTK
jgi:transcriptional regulator with XRE-family HTH domain